MAKIRTAISKISGKIGNEVFVNSTTYGQYTRKAPEPGSKKDEAALKKQYSRTKFLNGIAGELNRIIADCSGHLKRSDFYGRLQSRIRKEPLNNRYLLLLQLKGMEINPDYPLGKLGSSSVAVKALKYKTCVNLRVQSHPLAGKYKANCYYYEVTLLSWEAGKKPATVSSQLSEWIYLKDDLPEFEFLFPKPINTKHWLLCLRQQLGIDETAIEAFASEGMQITDIGTFDKKEEDVVKKRNKEALMKHSENAMRKVVATRARVKAKKTM